MSPDGLIREATRSNIFVVEGRCLVTPSLDGPLLPGVMRGLVLERAASLAMEIIEGPLPLKRIRSVDEAFLTNSVRGIRPIARLMNARIAGAGTRDLSTLARDAVLAGIRRKDKMTTVADVTAWLEQFAPARLAESWDNVGLLWGDPSAAVERVMTCLTVTKATATEAIQDHAALIVSHHPVLFREVKRIRADLPETGDLWSLARAGISIASPHTAFDNTHEGINDILCRRIGLVDVAALRPLTANTKAPGLSPKSFKVVVFTPEADREAVSSAAFAAGAGRIGAYDECSFAIPGEGTFFGTDEANPTVGSARRRETVRELRLEFVCPSRKLAEVLASVRASHSYEEPAIDVYPLHELQIEDRKAAGVGRIGRFVEAAHSRGVRLVRRPHTGQRHRNGWRP